MADTYTTGHCAHKNAPRGCQLHNLQCGYPECDRKATTPPTMPVDPLEEARERLEALTEVADWLRREAAATMDTGYRGSFRPTVVQLERWAAVAERARCALAAAPPPPGVSRGLDREEVIAEATAYLRRSGVAWTEYNHSLIERLVTALSAPAGGGMEVEQQYSPLRSASPRSMLASGGKPPLDEPERAAGAWRDIASAPRDGTVFVGCSLDHPSFGSWAMYRRVRYSFDDEGNPVAADAGAWAILHDLEPDLQEGFSTGPEAPAAIAHDDLNTRVRYGWMPLPPADTGRGEDPKRTNPDPCAEGEA